MKTSVYLALFITGLPSSLLADASAPTDTPSTVPTSEVVAHDPAMIRQDGIYYLFTTGPGITVWSSEDMEHWTSLAPVFDPAPGWARVTVPEFHGHIWAPDISFHNGRYYLYYSVSAFGKNTSAIGLATNATLHPDDPDFRWVDHGKVIQSYPGITNWNAIDPHVATDEEGTAYMSFGSFWTGLKIARLMPDRLTIADCWQDLQTIASRHPDPDAPAPEHGYPSNAGDGAIEAPFIFRHADQYYLFASVDYCCRGPESTYKMIVGRSSTITGPYLDKEGQPLVEGGGTVILTGDENWYGVGHNSVYQFDGEDYLIFHGYDAADGKGLPKLRIEKLEWDQEGWPSVDTASQ